MWGGYHSDMLMGTMVVVGRGAGDNINSVIVVTLIRLCKWLHSNWPTKGEQKVNVLFQGLQLPKQMFTDVFVFFILSLEASASVINTVP